MRPYASSPARRSTRIALVLLVVALGAAQPGQSAGDRTAHTGIDCSATTAGQLVDRFKLNNFLLPNPVGGFVCGAFTGPGSEAMAIMIAAPTCWPVQSWAVLTFGGGQWRLVLEEPAYLIPPLEAVGSDIKETTAVYNFGDSRCFPTGGTHARLWHWDGSKLVAGPWTQVQAGKKVKFADFESPSRAMHCFMSDDPAQKAARAHGVLCQSVRGSKPLYQQKAWLGANGAVSICRVTGTSNRCHLACSCEENVPPLPYGQVVLVGRFRCESLRIGVRCTVAATGKGYLISRDRVVRVG